MNTYDFSRSFVNFRVDFKVKPPRTISTPPPFAINNARLMVACVCTISKSNKDWNRTYVLTESCKSEKVGVACDIWTIPNADMCLVAGKDDFMIVKSWAKNNMGVKFIPESLGTQPERQSGDITDVWTRFSIDLCSVKSQYLNNIDDIVNSTLDNRSLTARIEYEQGEYHICIDHPVKIMNVNEVDRIFQTDTGPVLLPDLSKERIAHSKKFIEILDQAYAAFNCPEWAEFVINVPTALSQDISVNHYSTPIRIENTRNCIFAL